MAAAVPTQQHGPTNNADGMIPATPAAGGHHQQQQQPRYEEACYQSSGGTGGSSFDLVCVTSTTFDGGFKFCSADLDGQSCRDCTYFDFGLCYGVGGSSGGYKLDCSNVKREYDHVEVCGDSATAIHFGGGGGRYSSYGSSYDDDDDFPAGFIFLFILVSFCVGFIRAMARRGSSRRPLGGNAGRNDALELVSVLAKEEIRDGNAGFKFFDAAENDPTATRLKMHCINADWESVRDLFDRLREEEEQAEEEAGGVGADKRAFYIGVVVEQIRKGWPDDLDHDFSMSPMLDSWSEAEPRNADCQLLRAETSIRWAWHARSAALADRVGENQWAAFKDRLNLAAEALILAKEARPRDALVYSCGMTIARGLEGSDVRHMSMRECESSLVDVANAPLSYGARVRALQYHCAKWHGSHQQMFSYARSIVAQLPDGHPLWVLVPMAHYERNLIEQPRGYWKRPDVVLEITGAYRRAFPGDAETTVAHATEPSRLNREWACRNYFAYALVNAGQFEAARRQIRVIGRRPATDTHPWCGLARYKRVISALGFDVRETSRDADDEIPLVAAQTVSSGGGHPPSSDEDVPIVQAEVV